VQQYFNFSTKISKKNLFNCREPDEDVTPKALEDFGFTPEEASRAKVKKEKVV